jgi:hypothetical protein
MERKITKEQYERAMHRRGYVVKEDEKDIFSDSERYGYGVYGGSVIKKTNKDGEDEYYVTFSLGSSCD